MFRSGNRTDPREPRESREAREARDTRDTKESRETAPAAAAAPVEMPKPAPAEKAAAPAPERSPVRPLQSEAVLGKGVTFDGTLRFSGAMRIEGTFKGHILAGDALTIGEHADVDADVTCGTITVLGEARGSLNATRSVALRSPARVTADVNTPSLTVDEGVSLEGTVRMRGAPARGARRDRPKRLESPAMGAEDSAASEV
ncbi:MAG: polymer-forming cytoskeletal protein [Chloroflexota bacterium]|nr:polymer-forming cytoskeletal protein [Chloroflexota bacterium]